jgi:hypothetical protein
MKGNLFVKGISPGAIANLPQQVKGSAAMIASAAFIVYHPTLKFTMSSHHAPGITY